MANDKDLARLRQGVVVWNEWRAQNPECPVDLSRAKLGNADPVQVKIAAIRFRHERRDWWRQLFKSAANLSEGTSA